MKTINRNTKNRIMYTKNNLFEAIDYIVSNNSSYTIVVPHVCNNINTFGSGFTYHIQKHYPIVKENFHLLGKKSALGYTQFVEVRHNKKINSKIIFANMIAQNGTISKSNNRPLNYAALVRCMLDIKRFIDISKSDNDSNVEIHAPKFGSGLAGGNWNFIENLIEDIWSDTNVFIYTLK